jgi:hypothetical protein
MFFKTLYIALAMIVLLLGAILVEAVLRDRPYAGKILLGITGIYAAAGMAALLCSFAGL